MPRSITIRLPCGLIPVVLLAGCAELPSVRATATAGIELSAYRSTIETFDDTCVLERSMRLASRCAMQNIVWSDALDTAIIYADELARAAGAEPVRMRSRAESVKRAAERHDSKEDTRSDVPRFAIAVQTFLNRDASRASLELAIETTDPPLQTVASGLSARITTERHQIDRVICRVSCLARAPLDEATCPGIDTDECKDSNVSNTVQFAELRERLNARKLQLEDAQRAIASFARAHHALATHSEKLAKDATYRAVRSALSQPSELEAIPSHSLPPKTGSDQ